MLTIEVTETISCTPDELLEFVMDPEQYALVDSKIRPVRWVRRDGNLCEFGFRSNLAGLPGPPMVSQMRLTPGERIDVRLAPPPANRLTRLASDFDATFVCTSVEGGTRLVRTLNFRFRPALRWLAEPLLRRRLNDDVREEVRLAKTHLERPRLRPAHADDIPAAAAICHAGWREVHLGHLPAEIDEHRRLADFRRRLADDLGAFTVATLDGIVVGVLKVRDDEIEQLYVTGRARGTGVSRSPAGSGGAGHLGRVRSGVARRDRAEHPGPTLLRAQRLARHRRVRPPCTRGPGNRRRLGAPLREVPDTPGGRVNMEPALGGRVASVGDAATSHGRLAC